MRRVGPVGMFGAVLIPVLWVFAATVAWPHEAAAAWQSYQAVCDRFPYLCTDPAHINQTEQYIGHDEPALLFYSSTPGAGNSYKGVITLPKDPKTKPNQSGTAGTWNFQLHPAFWFGMAMCDSQSFPEFTSTCLPDTDANVFDNANPAAPDFIGNHPGTAFMEMQFYPPGWVIAPGTQSCSATKWCAAMNVDSYSRSASTQSFNNRDCQNLAGDEYVNFAYITKSGHSVAPASPLTGFANQTVVTKDVFLMNAGDTIEVRMFDNTQADPAGGFEVVLTDLNTGKSGSMTASENNGFAQLAYQPLASVCTPTPYSFHPMYASSTVHTRVPWAAHSYNVAYSDEIGHFEYCSSVDPTTGNCTANNEGVDSDDYACFDASQATKARIGGCLGEDLDFDGPAYLLDWPGTLSDPAQDAKVNAKPAKFNGSFIGMSDGVEHQFDSTAFETDLAALEQCASSNCPNPPAGMAFYPFFSSGADANGGCVWQEGGGSIPNSNYTFGGTTYSDSTEYGTSALGLVYPYLSSSYIGFEDFQNALSSNECLPALPSLNPSLTSVTFKSTKVGKKSAAKTIKLTNSLTNKAGLGVGTISPSLDDPTDFTISKNTCTKELLPKKHCTISVKATPTSATTISGNLIINADAANGPLTIPLSVTGD